MGIKRGVMKYTLHQSKDHPGFWIAEKWIDGRRSGYVQNLSPFPDKPSYLFASEQEAAKAAEAVFLSPMEAAS